jgi:hypothetical protein
MEKIQNRSLSLRLVIGVVAIVALGTVAMLSFTRLSEASAEEWRHAEKRTLWAYQISQLRENIATLRAEQLAMLTAPDAQQAILETSIRQRAQDISRIISDFTAGASEHPELDGQIKQLSALHSTVRRRENLQILPGLRQGKAAGARAMLAGVQQQDFGKLQDTVKDLADKMEQNTMKDAAAATASTQAAQSAAMATTLLSMVMAAVVMALLLLTGSRPAAAGAQG